VIFFFSLFRAQQREREKSRWRFKPGSTAIFQSIEIELSDFKILSQKGRERENRAGIDCGRGKMTILSDEPDGP
jgi:hypothetical protein